MTNTESPNRGYNLMIPAFLFLIGLGMVPFALGEGEGIDRIDDFALFAVGLVAALWYLARRSRSGHTVSPLALSLLALAFQVLGVVLEIGERDAFGDNAIGLVLLVALTLFALWQYFRRPAWIGQVE